MNDSFPANSTMPVVGLGVRGLPNLTGNMIGGGLYVLIAETPSARFPILAENLAKALNDELSCSIVVPSNPEGFLQRVEMMGKLNAMELIAANQLQVFVMQEEFLKKMFRFGANAFVSELEQFGIPNNSYILFDQADDVLSLHDITLARDQIDVLKNWFVQHHVTALLVFSRANGANAESINALMDSMNGIVRLGGDGEGLKLTFNYWQSPEGTIAARSYHLTILDSGLYEASAHADQYPVAGRLDSADVLEDEEPHYFYMNPDLGSLATQMTGKWRLVDTLVGMMHATRSTRSSTSILVYQRDTNLKQLAETVHTLRMSLGRYAKIIVQEKDASLRYQNEALLLKLGINLVVHRDVPTSRFPLMLESLKRQVFSSDVDINFEAALSSVLPATASGYQIPARFIRDVQAILGRGITLDIPCALIVGRPVQAISMVDLLSTGNLTRPGDLISSDGDYCYIFLNACPESVILKTLVRVFKMPIDTLIDGVRFLVRSEEILAELSALEKNASGPSYVDFSTVLVKQVEGPAFEKPHELTESTRPKPLVRDTPVVAPVGAPIVEAVLMSSADEPPWAVPSAAGAPTRAESHSISEESSESPTNLQDRPRPHSVPSTSRLPMRVGTGVSELPISSAVATELIRINRSDAAPSDDNAAAQLPAGIRKVARATRSRGL